MVDQRLSHTPNSSHSRHRRPPNYSSRRVQLQLLALVFLIMTVLVLMREARKPENWHWMWQFQRSTLRDDQWSSPNSPASDNKAPLDTRPAQQPSTATTSGEPVVTAPANGVSLQNLLDESLDQSLATAQLHGWSSVLDRLGQPRRDLLRRGLWNHRHRQPLDTEESARWPDLLDQLTQQWTEYEARAQRMVEEDQDQLTPAQQQLCRDVLGALHDRWQQQLSALAALPSAAPATGDQAATLAALQQVLDQRAWQAVEDNTVLRTAEQEAWFRSWELLESAAAQAPASADGPVSFVQLFSQPDAYRGRLVQVRGTARLGYHVASREQRFGINGYDVVWLRPADGSNSPMAVYLRAMPTGFPQLKERAQGDDGRVLQEEVMVTGVFFKRWLYGSRGGLNLAPLILGQITQWTPRSSVPADAGSRHVSAQVILYCVVSVALVGLALAVWVYHSSRWSGRDLVPSAVPPSELPPFEEQSVQPTVEESLRRMGRGDE